MLDPITLPQALDIQNMSTTAEKDSNVSGISPETTLQRVEEGQVSAVNALESQAEVNIVPQVPEDSWLHEIFRANASDTRAMGDNMAENSMQNAFESDFDDHKAQEREEDEDKRDGAMQCMQHEGQNPKIADPQSALMQFGTS